MPQRILSLLALSATLAVTHYATAQASNVLYVETNNSSANANAVLGFRRGADGTLTALPGSPFATNGTGVRDLTYSLPPIANDTPVIANAAHTLLFAVNEGSNSIAVFRIGSDGTLYPVAGSPFASRGFQPVSLSLLGNTLAVVNKNNDPAQAAAEANAQPNYTTFSVATSGALTPNPNGTVTATASPSQALAIPRSQYQQFSSVGYGGIGVSGANYAGYVFGADFGGGNLQTFQLGVDGTLAQNPPIPLSPIPYVGRIFQGGPAPAFPLGLAVNPNFPLLYVGLVTISDVGVYFFDPEARLFPLNAVPDPAAGADCWLITNRAGTRLYAVGTGGNTLTTFDIGTSPTNPRPLTVTNLQESSTTGTTFEEALSGDERYLYTISQQGEPTGSAADNTIHVLRINGDDSLTEIQTPALPTFVPNTPTGTRWQGIVAF